MEPLSALSVASSTVQPLDFGSKLWGRIHELYVSADGTTATHRMLRTEAKRLRDLNAGLGQLLVPDNLRRSLTPTEQAVVALCSECDDAANELVSALEKLSIGELDESSEGESKDPAKGKLMSGIVGFGGEKKRKRTGVHRKWTAVRAALKEVWVQKDIEKLCHRLTTLKNSVGTSILYNLQHEIANSSRKLSDLQDRTATWDSAKPFCDWHEAHKTDSNRCLGNLFDAIGLSRRRGNRTINDHIGHDDLELQPWSDMSGRLMDWLLDKLSFEEMFDRQDRIPDAFADTFQWVFEDPNDPERPWDNFSSWLTRGDGVYWITGKAGSGKSTMMRMLFSSPRTRQLLREWRQSNPIIISSFFFWSSGSALQMSEEGLLRSLLHQVLEEILKDPSEHLMRKLEVFCLSLQPGETIRFKDLKQLLRIVVEENDRPLRYFFLIDGLDEVEGDKGSLVALVHTLGTYPHIKICVSSRPWVVFEDGFRQQPSLMLQFLTYGDIRRYVGEKLTGQPAFSELAWGFPKTAKDLPLKVPCLLRRV